jgi:hypothetical protein
VDEEGGGVQGAIRGVKKASSGESGGRRWEGEVGGEVVGEEMALVVVDGEEQMDDRGDSA